ncbi:MAG: thioredoxin-disulfide reductase [Proteobacteria bacterium]|nr:thioredoxin-disulfide reductase [Pseudomonadota bacterium]
MSAKGTRRIVVVGAGPAGYTAAIYAARAGNAPVVVEGLAPGGQLMITTEIENFPGFAEPIQGPQLMAQMRAQAERVGAEIVSDLVSAVDLSSRPFRVTLGGGGELLAETLIVATGAEARWLNTPSEEKFKGRGVSACATCDGFFFRGKVVAVVGGGDTAAEEAIYLTNHASKVYLVHRRGELRASKVMVGRVLANPKIEMKWFRTPDEILGDDGGVTGLRLADPRDGKKEELKLDGVFIAIGHRPNTELLGGQLALDAAGYIATTPGSTRTSVPGVFAAGDVQDPHFRQAVTSAGTGCMAAIEAGKFLEENG